MSNMEMENEFKNMQSATQKLAEDVLEKESDTKEHLVPQDMLNRFHSLGSKSVDELTEKEIDFLINGIDRTTN